MHAEALPHQLALSCGPVSAVDLALFAAASGDHNPLHLDVEAARLFTAAFGAGSVRHLETRFTGVARLGDTVELGATLSGVENGLAQYTLSARTTAGTELVSGMARIACGTLRCAA